ncbi:MAG: hypothetical protein AB2L24_18540 [Mangrovibacterium sp.]
MKHFDLTPIENFLKEKNLTMNEVARDLYVTGLEVSRLGMYCIQDVKSDVLKVTADIANDTIYSLQIFATAFIENNLQKFFAYDISPEEMNIQLKEIINVYKNIIAGLTLLNTIDGDIDCIMYGREDHIILLSELANLCTEIDKVSQKAA